MLRNGWMQGHALRQVRPEEEALTISVSIENEENESKSERIWKNRKRTH